ncbi:MAG TPA: hypothetical protein DEP18_05545 [Flavobacteriales bacterium]|nr:hypothetical protein [Flavobacteriales bacterium]
MVQLIQEKQINQTMRTIVITLLFSLGWGLGSAQTTKPATVKNTKTKTEKASAQVLPAKPVLAIENNDADLGDRKEGSDVEYVFIIRNNGGEPLILSEVVRTCGCTELEWTKEPIMPGKTGTVKIKYDSKRVGPFNKSVIVNSNDPDQPQTTLRFKGVIVTQ